MIRSPRPDPDAARPGRLAALLTVGFPLSPVRLRVATGAAAALTAVAAVGLATVTPPPGRPQGAPTVAASPTPSTSPVALPSPTAPVTTARPSPRRSTSAPPRLRADSVAIPSQHVVAPVDTCQILNGGLEPPADVRRACFWAGGSRLDAAAGTTVITGHVNWSGQGTGALGNIGRLRPGDTVVTAGRTETGRVVTSRWRVAAVWNRPKTKGIDPAAFAGHRGARALYLITCGGAYDASELSYVDNIYVRAVPASSPPRTTPTSVHAG